MKMFGKKIKMLTIVGVCLAGTLCATDALASSYQYQANTEGSQTIPFTYTVSPTRTLNISVEEPNVSGGNVAWTFHAGGQGIANEYLGIMETESDNLGWYVIDNNGVKHSLNVTSTGCMQGGAGNAVVDGKIAWMCSTPGNNKLQLTANTTEQIKDLMGLTLTGHATVETFIY
ncbi:hypothetical protein B6390_23315 [Salmonella enterica]|nr:hypothetical protein [Salmonella enterica]EBH4883347.1 hypothetical protein [Salmonella enterica]